MKLQLFIALCLLNIYAEGKWRPAYNPEDGNPDHPHNRHEYNWSKKSHHRDLVPSTKAQRYHTKSRADPPDHTKLIPMARYVIHNTIWCSIATISSLPGFSSYPFTNVKSMVDGSLANSTGVPYFYMAPADFTAKDLMRDNRASVLASLEQTGYCTTKHMDPQDPRCTRVMLTGKVKKIRPGTPEYTFAKAALFERHPDMANYPPDHDWFVAKLKIGQIAMVDWFGGAKYIPVRDYLAYNYTGTEILDQYNTKRTTLDVDTVDDSENSVTVSALD